MRIASHKTLKTSAKTRRSYAYDALERDSLNDIEGADEAFTRFLRGDMSRGEQLKWALREQEYRLLTD